MERLLGIPGASAWMKIEPVLKGWSNDKKYYIEDTGGRKLLLRVSDGKNHAQKQAEYELIRMVNKLDFPMSRAVDFGAWGEGAERSTYMLLTWVEGQPLEDCLLSLAEEQQYALGVEAGRILKQIHAIPNNCDLTNWESRMQAKILQRVEAYENGYPFRIEGDEMAIAFVRKHIGAISQVEKVYQHGDFHIGNHIYTSEGRIGVIDFNRWDNGDYAEEFYKLQAFDRERSIAFTRGKLDGYFGGPPPEDFWIRHALYVAYTALYSIQWAIPFGTADIEGMQARCRMAFEDYDHFQRLVPHWYAEGRARGR
ncbi:phosphotransferase [Bacillus sp. FJAT-27264]|uniref:aminoglycoside phosphotransferase family protein n=1 Tax=Paenibacillus sp. (strain DSM 101736 / FJAT-27264) TaxID=1850362 RepID=UPI000A7B9E7D|nr:phosphotransferase [Bacillus sp. FJAT-27264]